MTRVALDSNILVYALIEPETLKGACAARVIRDAARDGVVAIQALGEMIRVAQRAPADVLDLAIRTVEAYRDIYQTPATTSDTVEAAAVLSRDHKLQFWDAVIIAASAGVGASVLLSEDMQDGRAIGGLRILNPFAPTNAAAIDALFPA